MGDAILIEIRSYQMPIVHALQGAVDALPKTWTVQYWHGDENIYYVPSVVNRHLNTTFPVQYKLGVRSQKKRGWWATRKWFNDILTSKAFWDVFNQTHLLLFQSDTTFCAHPSAVFADFLQYTYVGAPWHPTKTQCKGIQNCVGNCGLALFNVRDIKQILPYYHRQIKFRNFDIWLMHGLQNKKLAPVQVALRFSVETLYDRRIVPFGVHNPFPHLSSEDLHHLQGKCPEMQHLLNAFTSNW
jgi:hypothetical protein